MQRCRSQTSAYALAPAGHPALQAGTGSITGLGAGQGKRLPSHLINTRKPPPPVRNCNCRQGAKVIVVAQQVSAPSQEPLP